MDDEFFNSDMPQGSDENGDNNQTENEKNESFHGTDGIIESVPENNADIGNEEFPYNKIFPDNEHDNEVLPENDVPSGENSAQAPYDGEQQSPYGGSYNDSGANQQYRGPYGQQYGAPFNNNGQYNNMPNQGFQPPYSAQPAPKKKNNGLVVFIVIIIAIVALSAGLIIGQFARGTGTEKKPVSDSSEELTDGNGNAKTDNVGNISATDSSLGAGEASEVAKIAKPFNVGILIYKNNTLYTEGSGVIIKEDEDHKYTYIVTCAHVVNYNGVAVSVLMEDGSEYPADIVGTPDTRTDLAVVRIEASGFVCAEIADSDELIVGQTVYAVGNPGGSEFFGSLTNGIISAIDRPISSNTGYEMECIQHTAAINPGNSGGALVNGEGKLIGINSMKIASTEYEGMGFSVPSSVVIDVFNSIIENGYVAGRAKLGITYIAPSNYSQTYAMYVQMKGLPSGTIVINSVSEDSELASQDIKKGDMITKVNGKNMTNTNMLADMIENMSVGDSVTLTIVRVNPDNWSQTERDITVHLVEDKGASAADTGSDSGSQSGNPFGNYGGNDSYQDWFEYFREQYGF